MKELIKCLIDFGILYSVEVSVSIITSDDKTETFIIIRLTDNNYRVIKAIEYKQFEQLSNQHLYFIRYGTSSTFIYRTRQGVNQCVKRDTDTETN